MADLIRIHEDDWGLRNLYPLVSGTEILGDMKAAAAGERNLAPSGAGWTDVHVIEKPSIGYAELGLLLADAAVALGRIMPRVHRFYSDGFRQELDPNGSYDDDAWCFGLGRGCFIKLDIQGDLVDAIWFDLWSNDPNCIDAMRRSIEAIEGLIPSVVADYRKDAFGRAGDAAFLDRYFGEP